MTIFLVLILIGVLILAHEWGHFYSARKLGVKVEEFGFGFPPKIWSKTKNGIKYSINLLPFGGFVKIFGEHGEGEGNRDSFISRPAWQRFIILSAGVGMNVVLAWIFFSGGSLAGLPQATEDASVPVSVAGVLPGSPAEKAGLKFGDQILQIVAEVEQRIITEEQHVRDFSEKYGGKEITLVIKRGKGTLNINIIPRAEYPSGEGPMGIALARITTEAVSWYMAPWEGLKTLGRSIVLTISGLAFILKELILEQKTSVAVSGPVGIFMMVGDSRELGLGYLLQLAGLLSVNLAILNFLPIPALDGGRVLFLVIEKLRRKKIDPKWENAAHAIGFTLLLILMVLVTFKDISRIF
ncbi:MAG: M50 family metallopeptidase [bacterium]|nr:M50 family metallopeptidase [bacterium]